MSTDIGGPIESPKFDTGKSQRSQRTLRLRLGARYSRMAGGLGPFYTPACGLRIYFLPFSTIEKSRHSSVLMGCLGMFFLSFFWLLNSLLSLSSWLYFCFGFVVSGLSLSIGSPSLPLFFGFAAFILTVMMQPGSGLRASEENLVELHRSDLGSICTVPDCWCNGNEGEEEEEELETDDDGGGEDPSQDGDSFNSRMASGDHNRNLLSRNMGGDKPFPCRKRNRDELARKLSDHTLNVIFQMNHPFDAHKLPAESVQKLDKAVLKEETTLRAKLTKAQMPEVEKTRVIQAQADFFSSGSAIHNNTLHAAANFIRGSNMLSAVEKDFVANLILNPPKRKEQKQLLDSVNWQPQLDRLKSEGDRLSREQKRSIRKEILTKQRLAEANYKEFQNKERSCDCVAVYIPDGNKKIIVAANVKSRGQEQRFGIHDDHVQVLQKSIRAKFQGTGKAEIVFLNPANTVNTNVLNAAPHAEMQIKQHLTTTSGVAAADLKGALGVSKALCKKCEDEIKSGGSSKIRPTHVETAGKAQNVNPRSWDSPDEITTRVQAEIERKKKYKVELEHSYQPNSSPKEKLKQTVTPQFSTPELSKHGLKRELRNQSNVKARGNAGNIIEAIVENCDREGGANADTLNSYSGTYRGRVGLGAYAAASVAEANAHYSVFNASARTLSASAGAHVGLGGVSAMATAELCRAEASAAGLGVGVGLQLDTGASLGVDGVQLNLLGFGVGVGPKMRLKTPVADVSCSIM